MRQRSKDPHRNAVAVRFTDAELDDVLAVAKNGKASPFVRAASVEKARRMLRERDGNCQKPGQGDTP